MKWIFITWFIATFAGPAWQLLTGKVDLKADYATANRDSAHLAPDPGVVHDAVIQAYSARAFNWRGIFGSHCWIAVKPKNAASYVVYQVIGWRTYRGLPALSVTTDVPDRNWYNETPKLILDLRGSQAEALIPAIDAAARAYPYANTYTLWPGPNSNTFPATIARAIPALRLALPADALGKDYLPNGAWVARAPSGTGYQLSLRGLLGLLVARREGFEINILGVVYGVRFRPFTLLLPGLG